MTKKINDYFDGVAAKYLSAVDVDPGVSNQHEFGGLPAAGFSEYLGRPAKGDKTKFDCLMVYFNDEDEAPTIIHDSVTWYDCRENQPKRSPEYRLYYKSNGVTTYLNEGDFFLIAKRPDGSLLLVFTPADSMVENQLRSLFEITAVDGKFRSGNIGKTDLVLPLQFLLEELGIEVIGDEPDDDEWLAKIFSEFGTEGFPSTAAFSEFSRRTLVGQVSPLEEADNTLLLWMEREEKLFRILERHFVLQRINAGFDSDVDSFLQFSLSVQNRRKSRAGHAFEGHLDTIFRSHKLRFEQGRGKGKVTENNSRPDFLFPDFVSYHDPDFPEQHLRVLGAKTTCKDRWRQVLSEANKVTSKHLVTMQPAISEKQISEMRSHHLQLIIPEEIHVTYKVEQRAWLMSLNDFISEIKKIQS